MIKTYSLNEKGVTALQEFLNEHHVTPDVLKMSAWIYDAERDNTNIPSIALRSWESISKQDFTRWQAKEGEYDVTESVCPSCDD